MAHRSTNSCRPSKIGFAELRIQLAPQCKQVLEYARQPRSRWWRIGLPVLSVLLIGGVLLWRQRGAICVYADQIRCLWAQHELEAFEMGSHRVVYEDDAAKAKELFSSDASYQPLRVLTNDAAISRSPTTKRWNPVEVAGFCPSTWNQWVEVDHAPTRAATAYLHSRTGVSGKPRIIRLAVYLWNDFGQRRLCLDVQCFAPATMRFGSKLTSLSVYRYSAPLSAQDHLIIYGGVTNQLDTSRFTLRYKLNGKEGLIDGWIDGQTPVRLNVSEGELAIQSDGT